MNEVQSCGTVGMYCERCSRLGSTGPIILSILGVYLDYTYYINILEDVYLDYTYYINILEDAYGC